MANRLSDNQFAQLDELRAKYNKAEMSNKEISDILELFILIELRKHDSEVNNEWIDACVDLIQKVDEDELANMSMISKDLQRVSRTPRNSGFRLGWIKVIGTIAACLVLTIGIAVIGRITWIQGIQTQDEQMYFLEGHEITLGNEANANEIATRFGECQTYDFVELCDFLGFTPARPTWLPDGWHVLDYYASRNETGQLLSIAYAKEGEEYLLTYVQESANDITTFAVNIPQDGAGRYITLKNGLYIYISTNVDMPVAVWTTANSSTTISGPITSDELIQIILNIQ